LFYKTRETWGRTASSWASSWLFSFVFLLSLHIIWNLIFILNFILCFFNFWGFVIFIWIPLKLWAHLVWIRAPRLLFKRVFLINALKKSFFVNTTQKDFVISRLIESKVYYILIWFFFFNNRLSKISNFFKRFLIKLFLCYNFRCLDIRTDNLLNIIF
jgi:hypothetical protein